ncbi:MULTISPECIES: STAS domain-containing protein [unclassified Streptomyces]|uniref:STAS domain-containing protein n=1 Tax=unclassified Streptomyces TaxID=2593676 RepID=UPI00386E87CA|nr:STAS domain-containing protein [Streptomyces sp. NBC_00827]
MQQGNSAWPVGHIHTQQVSGVTIIEFHGEIDIAAAQQILPGLDAATAAPGRTVVLDLTPVEFFDCSGLRLLCRAELRVRERSGWPLLVCPHPLILRILHAGHLIGRFAPLATREEALALADSESEAAG